MLPSDLDSTAGSEWEGESNAGSQHLSAVSKEQLFNMLQKSRSRWVQRLVKMILVCDRKSFLFLF